MRTKNNTKLMKKTIRILKKGLTKRELKDVRDNLDLWEVFHQAYEEK